MTNTSPYREAILADDPLLYFPMDPDNVVIGFGSSATIYDRAHGTDNTFYWSLRTSGAGGLAMSTPASGPAGMQFTGAADGATSGRVLYFPLHQNPFQYQTIATTPTHSSAYSCYHDIIEGENAYTLEVLIKPISNAGVVADVVAIEGDGVTDRGNIIRYHKSGAQIENRVTFDTGVVTANATGLTLLDGNWHHIVSTWDGTDLKLYVDGTLRDTQTPTGGSVVSMPTSTSSSIGEISALYVGSLHYARSNWQYNGYMDDVALYSYALSASQISAHYALRNSRVVSNQSGTTAKSENPPFPSGETAYDRYDRARTIQTNVGTWENPTEGTYYGTLDSLSVIQRIPGSYAEAQYDRKVDNFVELWGGDETTTYQFGLCYDPRAATYDGRCVKFIAYTAGEDSSPYAADGVGMDSSGVVGLFDFDWEIGKFYRFELEDTGTGVALYVNNELVEEYTLTPSGFDYILRVKSRDFQDWRDPVIECDFLMFRAMYDGDEYTATTAEGDLDNSDLYKGTVNDVALLDGYIVRHRMHIVEEDFTTYAGASYSYELDDVYYARRPTMANHSGVEWLPVTNSIDW